MRVVLIVAHWAEHSVADVVANMARLGFSGPKGGSVAGRPVMIFERKAA